MIDLRPGDMFVVRTKSWIANGIIAVEHIYSQDHEAEFNHAGIILDEKGNTFESLGNIDHYNLDLYKGCPIFIARHTDMTTETFNLGMASIIKYDGKKYPWWRLGLFLAGWAEHLYRIDRPVCSELVALFLKPSGLRPDHSWGVSPDNLADEWAVGDKFVNLYDEVWA
jgi:hypothetical protein